MMKEDLGNMEVKITDLKASSGTTGQAQTGRDDRSSSGNPNNGW